ncbi:MAG TPA: hypothetical protein VJ990_05585 [Clostridia bacterium]|nr:hypothetical protein [Clostridia bacterium]
MLKIGILGATGYAGQNLVWLIKHHPNVNLSFVTSRSHKGTKRVFDTCIEEKLPKALQGLIFLSNLLNI